MKESRLHDELRSFPKNHSLKEESIRKINGNIDKELTERQRKYRNRSIFNKKVIATGFLTMTLAAILIWVIGVQEVNLQMYAGNHSDKILTIENKQNVSIQEELSPEDIHSVSQTQNIWAWNPKEPRIILMNVEGASVVHLKVQSTGEAEILPKSENFYTHMPYTPLEVEINETLYGNASTGKKTIYIQGGDIRISNLLDSWVGEEYVGLEKMGLTKLSREEQETKFISYTSEYDYKMKPGKEYAVILAKQPADDEIYTVIARGYGIFEIEETEQGEKTYRNVITGKTLNLDF
ncbi:hypothetical protein LC085_06525 [Bacillus tianshenii]|uniref:hypothetical protein n=1 Tax=Sutcliffiella tianshenii TaxID=1463404 RepID=UPI001CD2690D|nr:hypothetical protein [Bacillus tianshenii]MCA1319564.1 hypothetical protein [Bacillus tianshenii]